MSLIALQASKAICSVPSGRVKVEVDYTGTGNSYMPFLVTDTNAHQVKAIEVFLNSRKDQMTVHVPHSKGGIFVATFSRMDENHLFYVAESGNVVFFRVTKF
jgi:hypothetical protein